MKIVFMGTPEIAMQVLDSLYKSDNEIIGVVSQPDKMAGRGNKIKYSEVKEYAINNNLYLMQPEKIKNNNEFYDELKLLNPDAIVVCAYGKILPKDILDLPKYGAINVHASLLPRLRGASPIQSAILLGEEKTGVTIMKMSPGLDDGDMILKDEIIINNMNHEELYNELSKMGARLIIEALKQIENGTARYEKQDDSLATYVGTINKSDGKIDFTKNPKEIEQKIRAFDPWPGAFCSLNGLVFKFWKALVSKETGKPGEILNVSNDGILIAAGDGSILVTELQVPGKKRVKVKDYLLGNKINVGDFFD